MFHLCLAFAAKSIIVFQLGRYTTRKTHNEPDVRAVSLRVVRVRTLLPITAQRLGRGGGGGVAEGAEGVGAGQGGQVGF